MTHWNYRVIKKRSEETGESTYQVHEVYYTPDGSIDCWTQTAVEPMAISEKELNTDIRYFLRAFRYPVLERRYVHGQEKLVECKDSVLDPSRGYQDYIEKITRVMNYVGQALGRDLALKTDPKLRAAYEVVEQSLFDLLAAASVGVSESREFSEVE